MGLLKQWRRRVAAFRSLSMGSKMSFGAALLLNPLYKQVLHRRGVIPARELAIRLAGKAQLGVSNDYDLHRAKRMLAGVVLATNVGTAGIVCLPRSLTFWTLLRRRGVQSELIIGFDPTKPGIGAHAWVTVAGVAVGEDPTHIASLHVFDEPILVAQ
jgi:Transglutaminase-like superfamily